MNACMHGPFLSEFRLTMIDPNQTAREVEERGTG
jgi:hypothetical protein